MKEEDIKKRIEEVEAEMNDPSFWQNKERAQKIIQEYNDLKSELEGVGKYDKKGAVLSILAGAGGSDAEDFAAMLFNMYFKYLESKGWPCELLHKNENDHGGFRNITVEIDVKNAYGVLKNESGVHRLVRISPFNAKQQRHTSFALVEVIPRFEEIGDVEIKDDDLEIELSKSGGPGGQNVNKRETAVRVIHTPTGVSAHVDTERSQAQNKEKAMQILHGKLYKLLEEQKKEEKESLQLGKVTQIEWGNQIRSYVLHPYKMVKDHRTGVETKDPDRVLDGDIQEFIDAEAKLKG
ncbi:MAG: PCRF domain-containing protein [Candidatus Paceibacterota bacterium]